LTDTGKILSNLLLDQGLVSEISLLIHPIIVGKRAQNIFSNINYTVNLKLQKKETLDKGYVWLIYAVN
jgi:2,5-diamino-6-(ribosylamino)-4(3H)-pyrimidinone 5'-phosphate reductase